MKLFISLCLLLSLSACVGDIVEGAADTAGDVVSTAGSIAGALIPF